MARVFISYAREDGDEAARLTELVEARGDQVFWDDRIEIGHRWDETLERELREADRVIVLWSRHSVDSEWVRLEAGEAGPRLLPALIEAVKPPLAFRLRQTVDLTDWEGGADHPGAQRLLASIRQDVPSAPLLLRSYEAMAPGSRREWIGSVVQVAVVALGLISSGLLDIAPVSDPSLRLLPGAVATILAVLIFLAGQAAVRFIRSYRRSWLWRGLALLAAVGAALTIPVYARNLAVGTVEVPIGSDLALERRVVGTEYTKSTARYLDRFPERAEDLPRLIQDAGGIEKVWTPSSIHAQWESLTKLFVLGAGSVLLALLALAQALKRRTTLRR